MSDADRTTALADALEAAASERAERASANRSPRVVEVAVGDRTAVAAAIAARGAVVLATDVVERSVQPAVGFRRDDLHDPERSLYCGADLLYALRLPPELQGPLADLAADVGVPAAFTTLGGDPAVVPARAEQLPSGATIHWIEA